MNNFIWVCIAVFIVTFSQHVLGNKSVVIEYAPMVQLTGGKVRGLVLQLDNTTKLNFYQGIRYGKAVRFEKATSVDPWTEVIDATTSRSACPQPLLNSSMAKLFQFEDMNEDCLYLNVWSPVEEKANRTVMFYIHGGAFMIGTIFAPLMDARYIANQGDVVVVSINYRLGPLGFLHGGDVPGNLGLLDQILALKWVQENIRSFGGNPNDVTIFGASAGSISVGSLVLSPLTKGFFKRAILQAGAPNSQFTISLSEAVNKTKQFADRLKCPTEDNQITVDLYGDEVMPTAPIEALNEGKFNSDIDIMYGVTKDEGSYFAAQILPKLILEPANLTINSTKQDIIYIMNSLYGRSDGDEVANFYTDNLTNPPDDDDLKIAISKSWGDYNLICPTILFGEQIAKHTQNNRLFSYRLMQHLDLGIMPFYKKWMGVTHGQDSFYTFGNLAKANQNDQQLGKDMIQALTSFAKSGDPGKMGLVQWEEAIERNITQPLTRHMSLDVNDYRMVSEHYRDSCNLFWKDRITQ